MTGKEQELRVIIQEAWCGDNLEDRDDTFGAFLTRAAKSIVEAGYAKLAEDQMFAFNIPGNLTFSDCSACVLKRHQEGWRKVILELEK